MGTKRSPYFGFPCRDCERVFETGKEFSDHFERPDDVVRIFGCKPAPKPQMVN